MTTREQILSHLSSHHYRPMRLRRLARFFDVTEEDYPSFRALVKELIHTGAVEIGERGKLLPRRAPRRKPKAERGPTKPSRQRAGAVRGRFSLSTRGFGFVMPETPEGDPAGEDVFIPPDATLGAVTNDLVVAEVGGTSRRGPYGRIVEIVERGQTQFVGTYLTTETGPIVRPDGGILVQDFAVPDASSAGARPKDKVVFEALRYSLRGEPGEAVIVEVLGPRGAPGVDTLTVIRQFHLPDEFGEDVLADARGAADRIDDEALRGRRDLTGETVVTIDPVDARDFDDAISLVEHADGTVTLGVHIADVAHFVREGGPLDREARERGTSVYLPGTVVPMLPEILSNGVCSLQEGRTRLVKSAFIRLSPEGEPLEVELANAFIRSAKRLTYEEASATLEGKTGGLAPEIVALLQRMDRVARQLLERRRRQGYMELDIPDVDLELDDEGKVVAAHPQNTSFSHRIIEMFMVEANEAVARELDRRGLTCLRRIHPEPDAEGAENLKHYATSIGYRLDDPTNRRELQHLCNEVRGRPEAYGIHLAVLRSLKRAEYSTRREGHFALASEAYCHFTSPIRRYPDLTVHRLFDAVVTGHVEPKRGGRHKGAGPQANGDGGLNALAAHACKTERRAEDAEHELVKVKLLEYLEGHVGETFTGIITGVQEFGAFVENPHWLIDGLVHISNLRDDAYTFDRRQWALVGRHHGRMLRVGSTLEVRIARISIPRRQLDLEPVEAKPSERSRQTPRRSPNKPDRPNKPARPKDRRRGPQGRRKRRR